jgi:hypothetical protein
MATGADVLSMLLPEGGWIIVEDDFDSIIYVGDVKPLTEKQFTDGFAAYDAWKAEQVEAKASAKAALLSRLGITAEEAALLLA